MGAAVSITRPDLTASELPKAASGEKDSSAARRMRLRWCWMAWTARRRPKPAAWTVRPCGTGCIVTTPRDWPGFAISNRRVLDQNSRCGSKPNWPSLSRPVPTPRCTVSCVGGGSICATNCSGASVSRSTNVRSGRFWPSSVTANYRLGPATHRLTKKPRRRLKKLRRDRHGANSRPCQRHRRPRARVGEATPASDRWRRHGRLVGADLVSAGPCCSRARRNDRRCLLL
jgi:hypothetical protein